MRKVFLPGLMLLVVSAGVFAESEPWDGVYSSEQAALFGVMRSYASGAGALHGGPCVGKSGAAFAACMEAAQSSLFDGVYGPGGMASERIPTPGPDGTASFPKPHL